jgi:hypothetical protein
MDDEADDPEHQADDGDEDMHDDEVDEPELGDDDPARKRLRTITDGNRESDDDVA